MLKIKISTWLASWLIHCNHRRPISQSNKQINFKINMDESRPDRRTYMCYIRKNIFCSKVRNN